jgi:hypothetical protein
MTLPKRVYGVRVPPFHVNDNVVVSIAVEWACTKVYQLLHSFWATHTEKREHIRYAKASTKAYVNMSPMTTPGPPGCNHSADDPMHDTIAVHISHVRLSIAQKATVKTVPIPSILHKIMNKIRDIDQTTIYHDILGHPVSLEQFSVDKDAFDTAFGTIVPEGRNSQVIVGLTIHSTKTFGTIKNAIMPTLRYMNTFTRPHHTTSWKTSTPSLLLTFTKSIPPSPTTLK